MTTEDELQAIRAALEKGVEEGASPIPDLKLQMVDLDPVLRSTTYKAEDIKLWQGLKPRPVPRLAMLTRQQAVTFASASVDEALGLIGWKEEWP